MDIDKNELSGGTKVLAVVANILMIGIGIYLFFNLRYIVWLFSAAVLVRGVVLVINYLGAKGSRNGWDIISGVINILFGAIMLLGSTQARVAGVITIEWLIAFWVLFAGFSHIFVSFGLRKAGVKSWLWTLIGGILLIICGIVFISMPLLGTVMLVEIVGVYASIAFIIAGLTGLAATLSSGGE